MSWLLFELKKRALLRDMLNVKVLKINPWACWVPLVGRGIASKTNQRGLCFLLCKTSVFLFYSGNEIEIIQIMDLFKI